MKEEDLRALVRDAIARHLGPRPGGDQGGSAACGPASQPVPVPLWRSHPSFGKFLVPRGTDEDGPCLIEPAVPCNHCGFCQSYGH